VSDLFPARNKSRPCSSSIGTKDQQRKLVSLQLELWHWQFIGDAELYHSWDNIHIIEAYWNIMRIELGVSEIHRFSNPKSARLRKSPRDNRSLAPGCREIVRGTVFRG
jgi:hypothetical protein